MSFYDEFLKAANDEQNGRITRDELLTITKKLISETMPNIPEDKLSEYALAAIDPTKSVVVVTSGDGPAYGESIETAPRSESMPYQNRFYEIFNSSQRGELDEDGLLSAVMKLAREINPGIADKDAAFLARISINNARKIDNFDLMKELDLPDGLYELPNGGALQVGAAKEEKMSISLETQARCEELLARVDELIPPVDSVRLKPSRGKTTVFSSKLGGVPYFPKSMKYPTVSGGDCDGEPLRFLAQLNFEELPKLPGFPTEGILQFFAGYGGGRDDVYGMNFDDGQKQDTWRVIYHEKIITDESLLLSEEDMPKIDHEEGDYPFEGEFKLTAESVEPMPLSSADFRFEKAVVAAYNEIFGGDIIGTWDSKGGKGLCQVDEPLYDAIYTRDGSKTRMGGYPAFTQEDPRGYNDEYAKCTVMLFQSDSESGGNDENNWDDEIMWGDCGVANFFISPEDLAKRDFSHVLYNWDCG